MPRKKTSKTQSLFDAVLLTTTEPASGRKKREIVQPQSAAIIHTENAAEQSETEKVLSVSDYLDYINQILKVAGEIKVIGEISRMSLHPTGVYLTLKDKAGDGVLDCYINPYTYRGLGLQLEEGMEIKVTGLPGIFKRRSQLSFRVEAVELAGEGTLKKAYELLKAKLAEEGLFDRKRELPEFIHSIGIITSRTGAVIDDFRHNLAALGCKLYLCDCRVEGTQAPGQIINAVQYFNKRFSELDCLVIMRGGGSLEDMQAFNSEAVVKEIFASRIPVIAAIGHDRDVPLACMAADRFTSTPTAAAILISSSWQRLELNVPRYQQTLLHAFQLVLEQRNGRLERLTHQLTAGFNRTFERFNQLAQAVIRGSTYIALRLHHTKEHMQRTMFTIMDALSRVVQRSNDTVLATDKLLATANPERNLKLGYSLAYDERGTLIRSSDQTKTGQRLHIKLHRGGIDTEVINNNE